MAYIFKLQNGRSIDLTALEGGSDSYALIDSNNKYYLTFFVDAKDFSWEVENDNGEILHDEAFDENMSKIVKCLLLNKQMGIEESLDDEHEDPFNPEEISIDTKPITMETLMRRLQQGTITLNPDFQRQEVWDQKRKSQLIESLLLKIPIPMFYVSSDEKSNWTVVDGLQRISTLRDFVLGKEYLKDPSKNLNKKGSGFKLQGLEFWTDLEDLTLNDLPTNLQNRILETTFTFTIINPGLKEFKIATDHSIHTERMEDKELILRFISFMIRNYVFYNKTITVDTWLSDTMILLNSIPELNSRELSKRIMSGWITLESVKIMSEDEIICTFKKAMIRCHKIFGNHAFRKSYEGLRRSPINKSLFETWSNLLANITDDEFDKLMSNRRQFLDAYKPLLDNTDFIISISRDSMKHAAVKFRFDKLNKLLKEYIS